MQPTYYSIVQPCERLYLCSVIAQAECAWGGRYIGRLASDIILAKQKTGQTHNKPANTKDTGFISCFCPRKFDLLIAVGMLGEFLQIKQNLPLIHLLQLEQSCSLH